MKTTVEIDDTLLRAAKQAALDRRTTLRAVMEAGLRRELAAPKRPRAFRLATVSGGAPDWIADRDRMWDWLDQHGDR